jgi:hypothetical protein
MVTIQLLREGKGPARVVGSFSRDMALSELFEKIRPSQLVFVGTEPPTVFRRDDDHEEDSIRIRDATAAFVRVHDDPSGTFAPGYYFIMGVSAEEVKTW